MYELFGIKFVLTLTDIVVMVVCGGIFVLSMAGVVFIKYLEWKHRGVSKAQKIKSLIK